MADREQYDRHAATADIAAGYLALINSQEADPFAGHPRLSLENLAWLCREIMTRGHELPIDKPSRWLGFIQGCLAMRGLADVDAERSATRPLFHRAYRTEGLTTPGTHVRNNQS